MSPDPFQPRRRPLWVYPPLPLFLPPFLTGPFVLFVFALVQVAAAGEAPRRASF